jgi:DUF971 family protein
MYKEKTKMLNIEPIGSYAIKISWNDGHDTGMYSWDHLRSICPCAECRAVKTQAG